MIFNSSINKINSEKKLRILTKIFLVIFPNENKILIKMNKKLYKLKSIIIKMFIKKKYLLIVTNKNGIKYLKRKQLIDNDNKNNKKK